MAVAQVAPTADEEKNMKALAALKSDTGWVKQGTVTIGATGSYFSQWAAGGINSLGINGLLNYSANYRRGKNAWDNSLILGYGMVNQGFATSDAWVKADDRINLTSKYGRQIHDRLFYAALLNFQSQFAPGYAAGGDGRPDRTKLISNLMAPAKMLVSLGVDYKPAKSISIFFSPITYRGIYVFDKLLSAQGAYGVEKGEITTSIQDGNLINTITKNGAVARHEVGAYLRVRFAKKFSDDFNLTSTLELFSNYLDKPQNVDLAWENIVSWKLSKYIALTTTVNFLYDDNTVITKNKVTSTSNPDGSTTTVTTPYASKGLQTRVISTLGLTYSF
jgi:hypothetical protein